MAFPSRAARVGQLREALHWGVRDERVEGIVAISTPVGWADPQVIPRNRLMTCTRPKLFIVGGRDELCSMAAHEALMAALPEPKEFYVVADADHLLSARADEVAGVAAAALLPWGEGRE